MNIHLKKCTFIVLLFLFNSLFTMAINGQQISIDRIEMMPDQPDPYFMRDWKNVAKGYDSLAFDLDTFGKHLPLIWTDNNSVNYPQHGRFGIDSYVGTSDETSAEAINVIPAVVGATLVGIDKSNQNGYNWVLMCEEFFNLRPEENVYLNNFVGRSGNDWWYDTMPNVFFYQLYQFYPGQGDFDWQFITVADRWLEALEHMGGSTTPWKKPYMNYRAWSLSTMTPLQTGVKQPEAAGALAWLMFMAYSETGAEKYRIAAEWASEYLNALSTNPSYELQLPYGVYTAARMNAELGTNYNVEKLLNWCFTPEDNVRAWGMTLGNWGGYDCYGLIGEAVTEGYAFVMNGYEHIGALVPMVRYDDRFTRAIGKWVLHCANASRLFYSPFLPALHQDSESWAYEYDPQGYIAYESMRETEPFSGISPFATGDAKKGGWAETNLGLYGSSHVGILGAVIDTTDVRKILKLDARKTDYFSNQGYPTYILYNPYDRDTTITLELEPGFYDIYDAAVNEFMVSGANGSTTLVIPADDAVLAVLVPSESSISYNLNRMYADGIIVDFNAGQTVDNYPPRIKSLDAENKITLINGETALYAAASDPDKNVLVYSWETESGILTGEGIQVDWTAPGSAGEYPVFCIADDQNGGRDTASIVLKVIDNRNPVIEELIVLPPEISLGGTTDAQCVAADPDGDSLIYHWQSAAGQIIGDGAMVEWHGPEDPGYYFINCAVSDGKGGEASDSVGIVNGDLVAHYPFSGNAMDSSGMGNHGEVLGAVLEQDHTGTDAHAYYFDGLDDQIRVPNHPTLNFQNAITVALWLRVDEFFGREAYPVSHGNWENRWKISITDDGVRWTVKTTTGIKDLDSGTKLDLGEFTHVVCVYDGERYEIYLNGVLDNASTFSGKILQTSLDLCIGQALPNNSNYNFKGVIDNVRILNRGLEAWEVSELYQSTVSIHDELMNTVPEYTRLHEAYPNPFNPSTHIRYQLAKAESVEIRIYDVNGRLIETLERSEKSAGYYNLQWDSGNASSGLYFIVLKTGGKVQTRKCIKLK